VWGKKIVDYFLFGSSSGHEVLHVLGVVLPPLALPPRSQFRVVGHLLAQLEHVRVLGHDCHQLVSIRLGRQVLQDIGHSDICQAQAVAEEEAVAAVIDEVALPAAQHVGQGSGLEGLEALFFRARVVEGDGAGHAGMEVGTGVVDGADHGDIVGVIAQEGVQAREVGLDDAGFGESDFLLMSTLPIKNVHVKTRKERIWS
jgi:hypothetical protein